METRFDYLKLAPDGCKARLGIEKYLHSCGPGSALASLNQDAGLADQWLRVRFGYALQGSEGPSANRIAAAFARCLARMPYTDRERATLAWTEALTRNTHGRASDAVYEEVRPQFTAKELSDLSIAIGLIHAWNRLSIAARTQLPAQAVKAISKG